MYCPMLKSQCHMHDCAWYKVEYGACSMACTPSLLDRLGDEVSGVVHYMELMEGKITLLGVNND
jgi:hypothetical protein